jgi:hypothetical protein
VRRPAPAAVPCSSARGPRGHPSRPSSHRATGFPHQYGVNGRNSAARVACGVVPGRPCQRPVGTPGQRRAQRLRHHRLNWSACGDDAGLGG